MTNAFVPRLLLISGSVRAGSVNEAVIRTVAARSGGRFDAVVSADPRTLPHFDPDLDAGDAPLPAPVLDLRSAIDAADGVLISTPEYAGAMPGVLKTLLEWTIGAGSLNDKPVGWINPSSSPTGARDAYNSLRIVLRYAGALLIEGACIDAPVRRADVVDGLVVDDAALARMDAAVVAMLDAIGERPRVTGG